MTSPQQRLTTTPSPQQRFPTTVSPQQRLTTTSPQQRFASQSSYAASVSTLTQGRFNTPSQSPQQRLTSPSQTAQQRFTSPGSSYEPSRGLSPSQGLRSKSPFPAPSVIHSSLPSTPSLSQQAGYHQAAARRRSFNESNPPPTTQNGMAHMAK